MTMQIIEPGVPAGATPAVGEWAGWFDPPGAAFRFLTTTRYRIGQHDAIGFVLQDEDGSCSDPRVYLDDEVGMHDGYTPTDARRFAHHLLDLADQIEHWTSPVDGRGMAVEFHELPPAPIPSPGDDPIAIWDTCVTIRKATITAQVKRFTYWDERDRQPMSTVFEVFVDGLPDAAGVADTATEDPAVLRDLAAVASKAAELLEECQRCPT